MLTAIVAAFVEVATWPVRSVVDLRVILPEGLPARHVFEPKASPMHVPDSPSPASGPVGTPVHRAAASPAAVPPAAVSLSVVPVVAQEASALGGLLPFIIVLGAMYLLLIRPQQKRAKAQRELVASLGVGDRVVTVGGIHGSIQSLDDDTIRLEVSPGTSITMARSSVGRRLVDADTGAVGTDEA